MVVTSRFANPADPREQPRTPANETRTETTAQTPCSITLPDLPFRLPPRLGRSVVTYPCSNTFRPGRPQLQFMAAASRSRVDTLAYPTTIFRRV